MRSFLRVLAIVILPMMVAGCGLPVQAQVASLIADGISMLFTEKTVTDHGLSMVAGKDCAVWRGVTGNEFCRDHDDAVMLAEGPDEAIDADNTQDGETVIAPPVKSVSLLVPIQAPVKLTPKVEIVESASIDNDSIDNDEAEARLGHSIIEVTVDDDGVLQLAQAPQEAQTSQVAQASQVTKDEADGAPMISQVVSIPLPAPPPQRAVSLDINMDNDETGSRLAHAETPPVLEATPPTVDNTIEAVVNRGGLHFVLASFSVADNAKRLALRNSALSAQVVTARINKRAMHRVVVGPFMPEQKNALRGRLAAAGFGNAWALHLDSNDPPQLAALP